MKNHEASSQANTMTITSSTKAPVNLRIESWPYPHLRDDDGCVIASDYMNAGKVDFIIRAVNAHADMLAALERCVEVIEFAYMNAAEQPKELGEARAAIAKATGAAP